MRFYIVDVFAEQKYQGNQLAVFILSKQLTDIEMQQIAKECNFSETTFIMSTQKINGGYDVRIFTPDVEIPFAGHPALGTAFIIHSILEHGQSQQIILNFPIGQIPVTILKEKNELIMKQNEPMFGDLIQPKLIAEILNINEEDIDKNFPIQVVSTGLPAVIVPIRTLISVKNCSINHEKYKIFIKEIIKANLLVFTPEVERQENDLHVRVFMDDTGFHEDAATGSANGNLAGYLLNCNFFSTKQINLRIEQGYEMSRYSLVKVEASQTNRKFNIGIGGKVIFTAKGEWF